MQSRVVLISDDDNFFEYITPKLSLRRGDELYRFHFNEITDKVHLFSGAVIIINSEEREDLTLDTLSVLGQSAIIVFSFNANDNFKTEIYKRGGYFYITLTTSEDEFCAILTSAYQTASLITKNNSYREILVKNNLLTQNNEVYIDYNATLENELEKIKKTSAHAVFIAIAPNETTKFFIQPNQIETIILNNIRKNDVLMNYAPNKYFLLLYDTDMKSAEKIWGEIEKQMPQKLFAGFANVLSKMREQVVNEALSRLHEAINREKTDSEDIPEQQKISNFKLYRQEIYKKLENIVEPVFFHTIQKYNSKLFGIKLSQETKNGVYALKIMSKHSNGEFRLTNPGLSSINIDITYQSINSHSKPNDFPSSKRITLEPDELEAGLLEDILVQFINEFKEDIINEHS